MRCASLANITQPKELQIKDFQQQVLNRKGFVAVYFTASWCKACHEGYGYVKKTALKNPQLPFYVIDDKFNDEKIAEIRGGKYNGYLPLFILFKDGHLVARMGNLLALEHLPKIFATLITVSAESYPHEEELLKFGYFHPLLPQGIILPNQLYDY